MLRKPWFYVVVVILLVAFVVVFFSPADGNDEDAAVPISTLIADVAAKRVQRIEVRGDELRVQLNNLQEYGTQKEPGVSLFTIFSDREVDASNVTIEVKDESDLGGWLGLVLNFLPALLFMGLIIYVVRLAKQR